MKVGFVLVCHAIHLRADGLFDAVGASQQLVLVDPVEPRLKRSLLVHLRLDASDAGRAHAVGVMVYAEQGEWSVVGTNLSVRTAERLHHLVVPIDEDAVEGTYRVVVTCEGRSMGEWPLKVVFRDDPEVERRTWAVRAVVGDLAR